MDINALSREIHELAISKGWRETDRPYYEIMVLCQSEVSEAVEEWRAGRPMVYADRYTKTGDYLGRHTSIELFDGDKPEGIAVEMADCLIRILDWCGKVDLYIDAIVKEFVRPIPDKPFMLVADALFNILSQSSMDRGMCRELSDWNLARAAYEILEWFRREGLNWQEIVRLKMEYNRTRPYRHGGKKA